MLEHGVEYDEQFAHTGDESHLLRFTSGQQPLVVIMDDRIEAAGCQRSHVQDGSDPATPAPDAPFAPHGAAVAVESATPTSAAICRRFSLPSSGRWASRARESCSTTPGTVRRMSSFSRHTGLLKTKTGRGRSFGKRLSGLLREAMDLRGACHRGEAVDFGVQAERLKREVSYHLRDRPMADADNYRLQNELGWHDDGATCCAFRTIRASSLPTTALSERSARQ